VRYAADTSDDVELRALHNRLTMTLVRRDGTWKVVHEHSSSPLDAETMKAILNR
jgi:ketosteroid isomerase-like protein